MTKVILISGKAQHGKDTCAKYMKKYLEDNGKTCKIIHYGDLLKFICRKYMGWDGKKDKKGRELLQNVGTDIIRKKNPDFWVEYMVSFLNACPIWDYVLIPDVRFPNEITHIDKYMNVWAVRINRPNFDNGLTEEQRNHISETALDNLPMLFDMKIDNIGTLKEFKLQAYYAAERAVRTFERGEY